MTILTLPKMVTTKALASELGVSVITLRRDMRAGRLGYVELGRGYQHTEDQVLDYIRRKRIDACPSEAGSSLAASDSSNDRSRPTGTYEHGTRRRARLAGIQRAARIATTPSDS